MKHTQSLLLSVLTAAGIALFAPLSAQSQSATTSSTSTQTAQNTTTQTTQTQQATEVTSPEDLEQIEDWTLGCEQADTQERCFLYQTIVDERNDRPIVQAAVGSLPLPEQNGFGPAVLLTFPLGIILPPGVQVSVDDNQAVRIPFEQCSRVGCSAILPLDNDLLTQFKRGAKAELVVDDGQRLLVIDLSLFGFTAGFNKLAI